MPLTLQSTVTLPHDVTMPLLGLGTFKASPGESTRQAVCAALAAGYRLIDTAAAYGNEESVGQALADSPLARREIFVTTKVWIDAQGYEPTLAACRRSLRALGLDYLDLYLIHWPVPDRWLESWRALMQLQQDGLCRAIGVSNCDIAHLERLRAYSPVVPAVNQVEFSPFLYRKALLDYCRAHGIQLEAYSPLTRGYRLSHPTVRALADKYGKTPAQLLIRWPLQHEVVVIPKSTHPARIRENADVFDFAISDEDMATLDGLNEDYATTDAGWRSRFAA
ncbi:MAG TPA: aldo/keto reductase [Armatimonadota bacterium]